MKINYNNFTLIKDECGIRLYHIVCDKLGFAHLCSPSKCLNCRRKAPKNLLTIYKLLELKDKIK